jgi:NAD(P)-dependent dehydrogenase (short-subunit alcohol dehydrogenase family)
MDLSLHLEDSHVLITGGAGFIGSSVVDAFLFAGSKVSCLDKRDPHIPASDKFQYLSCDISSEISITNAFSLAIEEFGPVACCVALASLDLSVLPHHESLADMEVEQWRRTHEVNVEGTFLTARAWLRQLRSHAASLHTNDARLAVRFILTATCYFISREL